MAKCWEVVIAGVTNDTCDECNDFNGTHILDIAESGEPGFGQDCARVLVFGADSHCSGASNTVHFGLRFGDVSPTPGTCEGGEFTPRWQFVAIRGATFPIVVYEAVGEFDCDGPSEFGLCHASDDCDNWPTSVTLEPIACA